VGKQNSHSTWRRGVGLLRTEFLYLERATMPDEEEQVQAYREILSVFGKLPVVLRTSDIGGG
jgi:phosphoenolpyruvate-protein kinase (PTS system EI component)